MINFERKSKEPLRFEFSSTTGRKNGLILLPFSAILGCRNLSFGGSFAANEVSGTKRRAGQFRHEILRALERERGLRIRETPHTTDDGSVSVTSRTEVLDTNLYPAGRRVVTADQAPRDSKLVDTPVLNEGRELHQSSDAEVEVELTRGLDPSRHHRAPKLQAKG